jgi:lysyl-tRNA synthetase class II
MRLLSNADSELMLAQGWGLGIDRLVMFLTNNYSSKTVVSSRMFTG